MQMKSTIIQQVIEQKTKFNFATEYMFHPVRKWRFDYAQIGTKTAVEVEGGAYSNGRHTRGVGFVNDMEKYNAAIELGWVVLRYTPEQMWHTATHKQIKKVCEQREKLTI